MNPTSRAILQSVLSTDVSLSDPERTAMQRLLEGLFETPPSASENRGRTGEPLLVTQKLAAKLLSVSRVTVWRLTKDCVLHPVEILPGTWRYLYAEVESLAKSGWHGANAPADELTPRATAA